MANASFSSSFNESTITLIDSLPNSNIQEIPTVQSLFGANITVSLTETANMQVFFETQPAINIILTETNPINIVVEKAKTITVVEDSEIRQFPAHSDLPKYSPVYIKDDGSVAIAKASESISWNKFIGINLIAVNEGEMATVKLAGVLQDNEFNWDTTKEIYLGLNGELTQSPNMNGLYFLEVAHVLTPKIILINHNEPNQLINID